MLVIILLLPNISHKHNIISIFFFPQLLYYFNGQYVPTVPTFHLPESSFIFITVEINDLPHSLLSWTFLLTAFGLSCLGVNTLQSSLLVSCVPISVSVIITFLLPYARKLLPDHSQSPQFCFWSVPCTSLFSIPTQSSFLQINHNLMCHFLNLDNFYDFLLPTGRSLKSLVWQTRFFTTFPNFSFQQPWQTLFSRHLWSTHWLSVRHFHMSAPQFMWSLPGAHLPYGYS